MSWHDRKINLPSFITHNRNQYTDRDVEANLIISGSLRKLKSMRKKWFVLYSSSAGRMAHLEYHDNERKWRAGAEPSRDIVLQNCLNICKKQDTRDSKNKHVIAIYTLSDCLSILFEEEQELQNWLIQLLSHQKPGRTEDGRIPKPNYEFMWQVNVKSFKPDDALNNFQMSGSYRLCVTTEDLKFFPIGSSLAISFPIISIRGCLCKDRGFQIETGRSSVSGAGVLAVYCDDKEISSNVNTAVLDAIEHKGKNPSTSVSTRLMRTLDPHNDSSSKSSHRPRAESCSKVEPTSTTNSSSSSSQKPSQNHNNNQTVTSSSRPHVISSNAQGRYRTTSEGNHFTTRKDRSIFSGSPMSPSPGSYVSSESAGSSNSLDDSDSVPERKHGVSMNEPQEGIIFEESSAESWVDPKAYKEFTEADSKTSPAKSSSKPSYHPPHQRTQSDLVHHQRTHSDLVHYTQLDMTTTSPISTVTSTHPTSVASAVPTAASPPGGTQYAAIVHPSATTTSSDYMVMTPTSGNDSSTSSLKRGFLIDHPRTEELIGLVSPSSQSSHTLHEDEVSGSIPIKNQDNGKTNGDDAYMMMSPLSSAVERSAAVPIPQTDVVKPQVSPMPRENLDIALVTKDQDKQDYEVMSPLSEQAKNVPQEYEMMSPVNVNKSIPASQEYEVMSPVNVNKSNDAYEMMSPVNIDTERLKRISEEDSNKEPSSLCAIEEQLSGQHGVATPGTPVHLRGDVIVGGARPKQYARSSGSKRSSFCSEGDGRWSPSSDMWGEHSATVKPAEVQESPDYFPIDYASSNRPGLGLATSSAMPIPSAVSHRMSPASSGSLISGSTPNSVTESRLPHEFHFDSRARSYLRDDDDHQRNPIHPTRAYSISVTSSSSLIRPHGHRSRTGSITNRFLDLTTTHKGHKISPSQFKTTTATSSGQSPNLMNRLDNWFRSRAGSVPSRPAIITRQRHRTQSEGEKDNADDDIPAPSQK